jgi:hypothetical protein
MITSPHLFEEIEALEKVIDAEKDAYKKASLKAQVLILKMLHSLRTNSVQIMRHFNIKTVSAKNKDAVKEEV